MAINRTQPTDPEREEINEAPDPFDPQRLRVNPASAESSVRKLLLTIPVRKPNSQDFIRVNPDADYRIDVAAVKLKEERDEWYPVIPEIQAELASEVRLFTLYLCRSRQGILFIWPVRLPKPDERRRDEWALSEHLAAEIATTKWTRVRANMTLGAYEAFVAEAAISEPVWPDQPLRELLRIAFGDRLIASIDHPVVQRLRGLV